MGIFGKTGPNIGQWDPGKTAEEAVNTTKEAPGAFQGRVMAGDYEGAGRILQDPANAQANIQGAHNTNMGDASNAYHTSVVDPLKEAGRQFQNWKNGQGGGGPGGGIPSLDQLPQVTGPGAAPTIASPTQGFTVNPITGQQIMFDQNANYAGGAGTAQAALIQQLAAQSRGQGPSLAEQQFKQAQEANVAAVMAQLASARGGANPMMQRQAMQTSSDIQAQTARDAATARLQEQLQAQGLLGQVSGQAINQGLTQRGQDIGLATDQAGLNQQANLAGFNAQIDSNKTLFLAQRQAELAQADLAARYAQMGMTAQQAQQQAALDIAKMQVTAATAKGQQNTAMAGGLLSGAATIIGGIYGGPAGATAAGTAANTMMDGQDDSMANYDNPYEVNVGGVNGDERTTYESQPGFTGPPTAASNFQYSDETLKTNISDGSASLEKMLSALSAKDYEYKDKKHGEGRFTGPMAQELLKSEAGKSLVKQGPDGLMVDTGRAALAALSANAMLLERVRQLESKKRKH